MTRLILIRHGETDWNADGRYQGQADPPLNARGWEQARQLAGELENEDLGVLYSSPLLRAAQTAEVIATRLGIPLKLDGRLVEIHQGDWQTRLRSEIQELYPEVFHKWETAPWDVSPPGGERLVQVQTRVNQVIDEICQLHAGEPVGIVTHRIPIALVKIRWQAMDPDIVRSLHLPNGYYEAIDIPDGNNPGLDEKP